MRKLTPEPAPNILIVTPDLRPAPPALSETATVALLAYLEHAVKFNAYGVDAVESTFGMRCAPERVLRSRSELDPQDWKESIAELVHAEYMRKTPDDRYPGHWVTEVRAPQYLLDPAYELALPSSPLSLKEALEAPPDPESEFDPPTTEILVASPDLRPNPPVLSDSGTIALLAYLEHAVKFNVHGIDPVISVFGMPNAPERVLRSRSELDPQDWKESIAELGHAEYMRKTPDDRYPGHWVTEVRAPGHVRRALESLERDAQKVALDDTASLTERRAMFGGELPC